MSRTTFLACGVAMALVAAAVRLNNALVVSVLGGYDAFAHFTYIWFLADTGRVPLADAGWEFFQPPLYYAVMAAIWNAFDSLGGEARLRLGTASVALLGLVQAAVALAIVRRKFPEDRLVQLLAAGLMLFVPVHLYSFSFIGNEGLTAAVCAVSLLLLVRTLERPTPMRAAALGLALGLAMLSKFTAIVCVAAAFGAIALQALVRRDVAGGTRMLAVCGAVLVAVCGWYYARNVAEYGEPFRMSRDQLFLARVENSQLQGERNLAEYLLFDPVILYRPQWPRGLSLNSPRPPGAPYSAMRESIPTGLYANAWFDGFGGFALPPVTYSEASRRAGQALLTLGLVPTLLMLVGVAVCVRRLRTEGWDDTSVALLLSLAAMAAVVIQGTRTVPTQAAVKASYLMPVSVAFAYFFAVGVRTLARIAPRLLHPAVALCALLAVVSTLVFTRGLIVSAGWLESGDVNPLGRNLHGVIAYAARDTGAARRHFEASALGGWHVGYENLAAIELERGNAEPAAWMMLTAASSQPVQARGTREERLRAIATTQAEYANSMAVIFHALGRDDDAMRSAESSIRIDPSIAESHYNLGVLELLRAATLVPAEARSAAERAAASFDRGREIDPAFLEARAMRGVAASMLGDCAAGAGLLQDPVVSAPGTRRYPVETGPGDLNAAGLHRRRRIDAIPKEISISAARERCAGS